jgi:3-methyladenine DNA glycosylase/8-oxoguanine DNA glycosylase
MAKGHSRNGTQEDAPPETRGAAPPEPAALALAPGGRCEFSLTPPFSFELTTHKPRYGFWATPFEVHAPGCLWSGFWTPSWTPVGVALREATTAGETRVRAVLHFPPQTSAAGRSEAEAHLAWMLGVGEDITPFYQLCRGQAVLEEAARDLYGMRDTPFADDITALVVAITLQMTSWKRSQEMVAAIYRHFGVRLAFDGREVVVVPPPQRLAHTPAEELRSSARLGYRAEFLVRAAAHIARGFPGPRDLQRLKPEEATRLLLGIPGVGRYSADIMTPHPSFPVDSWSRPIFARLLGLELSDRAERDLERIRTAAKERYGSWQSYVYAYVLHDWDRLAPRLGRLPTTP